MAVSDMQISLRFLFGDAIFWASAATKKYKEAPR